MHKICIAPASCVQIMIKHDAETLQFTLSLFSGHKYQSCGYYAQGKAGPDTIYHYHLCAQCPLVGTLI